MTSGWGDRREWATRLIVQKANPGLLNIAVKSQEQESGLQGLLRPRLRIWHNIASAIFCDLKHVIWLALIQELEKLISASVWACWEKKKKIMAIFGLYCIRQCKSMPVLQSILIRDLMRMSFLQNVSFNRIP